MCTGPLRKFQSGPVKFGRRGEEDRVGSDRIGSGPGEQPSDERENIDAKQS